MESLGDKSKRGYGFESSSDSVSECRESISSSSRSSSETVVDENKNKECSPLGWPIPKAQLQNCSDTDVLGDENKTRLGDSNVKKQNMISPLAARIDDLLYVDNLSRNSGKIPSVPTISVISHKRVSTIPYSMPASGTPYKSAFATSKLSPAKVANSPAKGERTPFLGANIDKPPRRGFGVKRVLTNYLVGVTKFKNGSNQLEGPPGSSIGNESVEVVASGTQKEGNEHQKELSALHKGSRLRQMDR